MRSALLLLGGLVLLAAGIAVIAVGLPGGLVLGPVLIVVGLVVKVAGFLMPGDTGAPPPGGSGRTVTTLGPDPVERVRGGSAVGRTSLRRPRRARTARASQVARAAAVVTPAARPGRRAS